MTDLSGKKRRDGSTVVTAGDSAFAWGTLLLVASMRRNGMGQPVVAGAMEWTERQKDRLRALGGVVVLDLPRDRRCVTCQKPILMAHEAVGTDWVCWADSDAVFVGDCSEWLRSGNEDEMAVRMYAPPPDDFTPATLETWRRDVERFCGRALGKPRYATRANAPFIALHRKWTPFLERWNRQIEKVLPPDVEIVMRRGTPYFQTDESVLGSLLCFDPDAPRVAARYMADGRADPNRYFAHLAFNPKPWRMWNRRTLRWSAEVLEGAEWLVSRGVVARGDLPLSLRRRWLPFFRAAAPAAPWVWRATKARRRIAAKFRRIPSGSREPVRSPRNA